MAMSKFALKLYMDQVAKLSLPENSLQKCKNYPTWFQWCTCPRTPRYMEYLWCCHQWSLEDVLHNTLVAGTFVFHCLSSVDCHVLLLFGNLVTLSHSLIFTHTLFLYHFTGLSPFTIIKW